MTFSFRTQMNGPPFAGAPWCEVSMTLATVEGAVVVRSWDIDIEGTKLHCAFSADGRATTLTIDGKDWLPEEGLWLSGPANLIPTLRAIPAEKHGYSVFVGERPTQRPIPMMGFDDLVKTLNLQFPELLSSKATALAVLDTRVGASSEMREWTRGSLRRLPIGASATRSGILTVRLPGPGVVENRPLLEVAEKVIAWGCAPPRV